MNAGAFVNRYFHDAKNKKTDGSFLFDVGKHALLASGICEWITTPARGGENAGGAFQRSLREAFSKARERGQFNPIVVGAIPFDVDTPSCLYVPETYTWQQAAAVNAEEPEDFSAPVLTSQKSIPDEAGFKKAVQHAIANFSCSDARKAVLSVVHELHFAGAVSVQNLLTGLRRQNRTGYRFHVSLPDGGALIGVSPELLIRKDGADILSNPLAGSIKRRPDAADDEAASQCLLHSDKDQQEHHFVVKDIRRLLTPFCDALEVPENPSLLATSTLWHLSTVIEGRLRDPSMNALQLACLLHPTPAVCGFPTEKAHRLIRLVEPFERGLFAGVAGWCDSEGNGEWVVTIRCGTVRHDTVRLFAGAGIIEASRPENEWLEIQAKLGTMLTACGLVR